MPINISMVWRGGEEEETFPTNVVRLLFLVLWFMTLEPEIPCNFPHFSLEIS